MRSTSLRAAVTSAYASCLRVISAVMVDRASRRYELPEPQSLQRYAERPAWLVGGALCVSGSRWLVEVAAAAAVDAVGVDGVVVGERVRPAAVADGDAAALVEHGGGRVADTAGQREADRARAGAGTGQHVQVAAVP